MFAGAYFRSSLVDIYRRSLDFYVCREVGLTKTAAVLCNSLRARVRLQSEISPTKSRKTPESQFAAYSSSVLNGWGHLWNSVTARELRDAPRLLRDVPTLIVHGSTDKKCRSAALRL